MTAAKRAESDNCPICHGYEEVCDVCGEDEERCECKDSDYIDGERSFSPCCCQEDYPPGE
jgi:hypothetical protein